MPERSDSPSREGFTIVEVMVVVLGFTLIAVGLISLVSGIIRGSRQQETLLVDTDQSRRLIAQVVRELRNAQASNTGGYPLEQAGSQQIVFYADIDGGVDIERLRYYLSSGKLYRGVVKPTGNPLTYNLGSEQVTLLLDHVANGAGPLFFYYPDTYNGVADTPLTQPVNVTQVRFVKLSLQVFNVGGVQNTNTYRFTAGAMIRNLKTNLGG